MKTPYFCHVKKSDRCFLVDEGNSLVKIAFVDKGIIQSVKKITINELAYFNFENLPVACSSVVENGLMTSHNANIDIYNVSSKSIVSFKNSYSSINSLGIDRLCNVQAMTALRNFGNRLAVDIGTCIKFDFLNSQNEYLGGSISPGIRLRYKSLNDYTHKLPLLNATEVPKLIGINTDESIISGVLNGIYFEILGMIEKYEMQFGELSVFLTGGDSKYFDFTQKNNIFAHENLTLTGIHSVYQVNAH